MSIFTATLGDTNVSALGLDPTRGLQAIFGLPQTGQLDVRTLRAIGVLQHLYGLPMTGLPSDLTVRAAALALEPYGPFLHSFDRATMPSGDPGAFIGRQYLPPANTKVVLPGTGELRPYARRAGAQRRAHPLEVLTAHARQP